MNNNRLQELARAAGLTWTKSLGKFSEALIREVHGLSQEGTEVLEHYGLEPSELEDMPLELEDSELLEIAMMAHDDNITLNRWVTRALENAIQMEKNTRESQD